MRVSGVTREGFGNRCEFRARFGQNQRVRCEMMLETLIYFRIWAVTVRFARFGCSKLATISRIQQTQKTDAYKKAGGTPIQFHRLVPTGLAGCSSSRARRLFQGQRQKRSEAARRVPRRLGGGGSGIECRILLSRGLKQSDGSRGTSKSLKRIIGQDLFWSP